MKRDILSFDKKIEELEKKADSKGLDAQIVDLIFDAETDAELSRGAQWLSKISEDPVRESATNFLWFKRAELAVKENRLPDAEKHAEKVSELEHRAIIYFKIAEAKLKQENLKEPAAAVLETAVKAALKAPNGVERAQVLLGTAFFFEKYNQYRAAEVLSEAVKTVNRLENPDLSASSIYRKIEGKDFGYYMSIATPGYSLEKSFAQVSRKDFQGALSQARNLDDKYLRTLAVIAVVGDCMEAQEKTPEKPKAKPNQPKPAAKKPTPKQNSD
jgi:tetratricopeptide (TPR) repeat protein